MSENIAFRSYDGTTLEGTLEVPDGAEVGVILAHGLTVDRDEYNDLYVRLAEKLLERGIASFRFDFRGHGASGGTSKEMTVTGELLDLRSALNVLEKEGRVESMGIIATSFGACSTSLCASRCSDRIDAVCLFSPVLSFELTYLNPPDGSEKTPLLTPEKEQELRETGSITRSDGFELGAHLIEEFGLIEPYEFLQETDLPILTVHGGADEVVPPVISRMYGVPNIESEYRELPDVGHGFFAPEDLEGEDKLTIESQTTAIDWSADWMTTHLA